MTSLRYFLVLATLSAAGCGGGSDAPREAPAPAPAVSLKHTHVFTTPEVMVPFKCDLHNWMNAWVGVLDHPFYAVSGPGGTFDIVNPPPGSSTIEAWHEKLGTETQMVTIEPKEAKQVSFTFML